MFTLLRSGIGIAAAAVALSGCVGIQGTRPEAMTGLEHARAAERAAEHGHPDLARAHRESAAMLERAEREACREASSAEPEGLSGLSVGYVGEVYAARGQGEPALVGARITLALEGRSLEQLGRIIQCRAARGAVLGDDADPFGLPGTNVRVSPGDAGWAVVELRTPEPISGEQIVTRARRAEHRM